MLARAPAVARADRVVAGERTDVARPAHPHERVLPWPRAQKARRNQRACGKYSRGGWRETYSSDSPGTWSSTRAPTTSTHAGRSRRARARSCRRVRAETRRRQARATTRLRRRHPCPSRSHREIAACGRPRNTRRRCDGHDLRAGQPPPRQPSRRHSRRRSRARGRPLGVEVLDERVDDVLLVPDGGDGMDERALAPRGARGPAPGRRSARRRWRAGATPAGAARACAPARRHLEHAPGVVADRATTACGNADSGRAAIGWSRLAGRRGALERARTASTWSRSASPWPSTRASGAAGRLVAIRDAGERRDLAAARASVQALRVAALALLQRRVDEDLDERQVGCSWTARAAARSARTG